MPGEEPLLDLSQRDEIKVKRYTDMTNAANKIHKLITENENLFEVDLDIESSKKAWNAYLRHIDNIVLDSLLKTGIFSNILYFLFQIFDLLNMIRFIIT